MRIEKGSNDAVPAPSMTQEEAVGGDRRQYVALAADADPGPDAAIGIVKRGMPKALPEPRQRAVVSERKLHGHVRAV
jgi:hypothetical protein